MHVCMHIVCVFVGLYASCVCVCVFARVCVCACVCDVCVTWCVAASGVDVLCRRSREGLTWAPAPREGSGELEELFDGGQDDDDAVGQHDAPALQF